MIQAIRNITHRNLWIRKFVGYHLAGSGLFDAAIIKYKLSDDWKKRIDEVMGCKDNFLIDRVPNAGSIHNGVQVMHNGLKIYLGSYYGPEFAKLLLMNKGVHEPQEERVFKEVLASLGESATMIEMGAFWSFYSMWFNQEIRNPQNFMIEPDSFNLGHGRRNFKLNKMKGTFVKAYVSAESANNNPVPTICLNDFVRDNKISFIDILHSDIQGFEYDMLMGAKRIFDEGKIGYVFISTHSNEVHYKCLSFLEKFNFVIIAAADLNESFSEDGLIAARSSQLDGVLPIEIDKRKIGS